MGDERAETYLRLQAEAELRRAGAQLCRLDAAAEDVWWLRDSSGSWHVAMADEPRMPDDGMQGVHAR